MSLVIANMKANHTLSDIKDYCKIVNKSKKESVICPPFVFITEMRKLLNKNIELGAQDCACVEKGPYTGEISAMMLKDICKYVIIGHSERRQHYHEKGPEINKKIILAQKAGLKVIYCIGESLNQKVQNKTANILERQIRESLLNTNGEIIIAYEPIWAIGTGKTPDIDEIKSTHQYLKSFCKDSYGKDFKIIYGGSVNPKNAKKILSLEHVDGALVGTAAIKPQDFLEIVNAGD